MEFQASQGSLEVSRLSWWIVDFFHSLNFYNPQSFNKNNDTRNAFNQVLKTEDTKWSSLPSITPCVNSLDSTQTCYVFCCREHTRQEDQSGYVFLPVFFLKSFKRSFSENMAMLKVNFFANSLSISSPVVKGLFSREKVEKTFIYARKTPTCTLLLFFTFYFFSGMNFVYSLAVIIFAPIWWAWSCHRPWNFSIVTEPWTITLIFIWRINCSLADNTLHHCIRTDARVEERTWRCIMCVNLKWLTSRIKIQKYSKSVKWCNVILKDKLSWILQNAVKW